MRITFAAFVLLLTAVMANAQSAGKPLAVVGNEVITEDQVNNAAASQLSDLDIKRLQFDVNWTRDRSHAIENALDQMVAERVITAEAKKRNMTQDQLVAAEVDAKIPIPSDAAVDKFWADNQSRINSTREQALPQIREYLRQQDREKALTAFIAALKQQYKVESFFEPARTVMATEGFPVQGSAQAPITIVEFSDFECPYCGALHPTLKEIEKNYADKVRVVYRQFPLTSIHPTAQKAAEASLCAFEQQKFWQLHDAMFTDQRNLSVNALKQKAAQLQLNVDQFNTCLDSGKYVETIRKDILDGAKAGVSGTPALFVNGRFLNGAQPYAEIAAIIDDELRRAAKK